jgi:hypothetical protein
MNVENYKVNFWGIHWDITLKPTFVKSFCSFFKSGNGHREILHDDTISIGSLLFKEEKKFSV